MKQQYILFDFDGVIADSFKAAFSVQQMICPHVTKEDYQKKFEGNINEWEDANDVHTDKCRDDIEWFSEYIPRMKTEVGIVPGMEQVITELEKKYTLVVVSSTISSPIREFLESHNLANHFDWIMGNDVHTSKVEKMKMVFAHYGVRPDDCVFITDTLGDLREAERVGVGAIGVSWGFHSTETLQRGVVFQVVASPRELPSAVQTYFTRA